MKEDIDVFILEDDPDLCMLMHTMLKYNGFQVHAIQNPALLANTISNFNPKLLLMDMLLSGSDGRDICRGLRKSEATKDLNIMMISAHPDAKATCLEAGANDFLFKPFDMEEFLAKINQLVGSR